MPILGILGGIASGKSSAARLLAGEGGRVIEADRLVRELYADPEFTRELAGHFGREVLDPAGRPDRARLAARAFADPRERAWLEARIHPVVRERIQAELESARDQGASRVVLDVPLLLENEAQHGLVGRCDKLVFVDSDLAEREARARVSRGWPAGEVARREATQMPLERKRARAHAVISNRGSQADLAREVARVLAELDLA